MGTDRLRDAGGILMTLSILIVPKKRSRIYLGESMAELSGIYRRCYRTVKVPFRDQDEKRDLASVTLSWLFRRLCYLASTS